MATSVLKISTEEVDQRAYRFCRRLERGHELAPALIVKEKEPLIHEQVCRSVSGRLKNEVRHAPASRFGRAANEGRLLRCSSQIEPFLLPNCGCGTPHDVG